MRWHRSYPVSAEGFETHQNEDEDWGTAGWAPSSSSWSASTGGRSCSRDEQRWSAWWYGEQRGWSSCGGSQAEQQRAFRPSSGFGQSVKARRFGWSSPPPHSDRSFKPSWSAASPPRHRQQPRDAKFQLHSGSRPIGSWFGWSVSEAMQTCPELSGGMQVTQTTKASQQRWRPWGRHLHEVWSWNFETEFSELLAAVEEGGAPAILALDTEFPGVLRQDSRFAYRSERYDALRENVDHMTPIQLGFAVASQDGSPLGSWTFNLSFDLSTNLHTQESVTFLAEAGVDFPRHAVEGIDPSMLAWRLSNSPLLGAHGGSPQWVTFAGWYDWGYLLKLLTGRPMPSDVVSFDELLASFCPMRHELRDSLPRGSLDSLLKLYSLERLGPAHTAGSDAMATLELFLRVSGGLSGQVGDSQGFPECTDLTGQEPDFWKVGQFLDCRAAAAVGSKPRSMSGVSSASTSALSFARAAAGCFGTTASDQASSSRSNGSDSSVSSSGSAGPPASSSSSRTAATCGCLAGGEEEDSNDGVEQLEHMGEQDKLRSGSLSGLRAPRGRAAHQQQQPAGDKVGQQSRLRREPAASPREREEWRPALLTSSALLTWCQDMSECLSDVVVEAFASVRTTSLAMALLLLFLCVFFCCYVFF
eukprot:TRINITY_DN109199_c0_g1_i1.p1 TRINITY_DN109199_c0_g1~~TRINITY_DN109199_c0_g1_i1.p1  ORF type:complete len:643 (-),score=129.33 TRINITY_DN109199_c0_g1_i1:22-1950(-)